MTFWLIVLGVIATILVLAYRHDRRRKGQVGDLTGRAGVVRRYPTQDSLLPGDAVLYQELPPPQEPHRRE